MQYRLEKRDVCLYCNGTSQCYPCDGRGGDANLDPCEECDRTGVCQECWDGYEYWLVYDALATTEGPIVRPTTGGIRGSMIRRGEIDQWLRRHQPPDWFTMYHGLR